MPVSHQSKPEAAMSWSKEYASTDGLTNVPQNTKQWSWVGVEMNRFRCSLGEECQIEACGAEWDPNNSIPYAQHCSLDNTQLTEQSAYRPRAEGVSTKI